VESDNSLFLAMTGVGRCGGHTCSIWYCMQNGRKTKSLHADHIIHLSRNGKDNCVCLHSAFMLSFRETARFFDSPCLNSLACKIH
jgi:hypothetical protein